MRISDWSSDVCSSDLSRSTRPRIRKGLSPTAARNGASASAIHGLAEASTASTTAGTSTATKAGATVWAKKYSTSSISWVASVIRSPVRRSEEHTSELQSLMRNSYAVFCLKTTKLHNNDNQSPKI